jgi:hypothetical protein
LLGKFTITGLESERPGDLAQVTVQFDFGVDGILRVTARDRHTSQEKEITVDAPLARLSEIEILRARLQMTMRWRPSGRQRRSRRIQRRWWSELSSCWRTTGSIRATGRN